MTNYAFNADIKLLHINARSLPKNICEIRQLISMLGNSFPVIGISESWLKSLDDPLVGIPGYAIEGTCRQNKRGGVALYIQEDYKYKIRNDICINAVEIDSCIVEIYNSYMGNIIVGIIYRPPDTSTAGFVEIFNDFLSRLGNEKKWCYLMGDFNVDLLHFDRDNQVQQFVNTLSAHSSFR